MIYRDVCCLGHTSLLFLPQNTIVINYFTKIIDKADIIKYNYKKTEGGQSHVKFNDQILFKLPAQIYIISDVYPMRYNTKHQLNYRQNR